MTKVAITKETFTRNFNKGLEILETELKLSGMNERKIWNIQERLMAEHIYDLKQIQD
jgi:hypothetical protein